MNYCWREKKKNNTQLAQSTDTKQAMCTKNGKTCKVCTAREKCIACTARENMQSVHSAGKNALGAQRGKTCKVCTARENTPSVHSAGKHAVC